MIRKLERPLLLLTALLAGFGIVVLYSAGQTDIGTGASEAWIRQSVFLAIGVVAAITSSRVSFRLLEWAAPWAYGFALLLLALTLVIGSGSGTAASSNSWLGIGGARIQPAEFAKLATIVMLARWLAARREPPTSLAGLLPAIAIAGVPALLVLMQPDLGSAIVFAGILFATLFWAGVAVPLLVYLASPVISLLLAWSTGLWSLWMVALFAMLLTWRPFILEAVVVYLTNSAMGVMAIVVWNRMGEYQRDRILTFIDPYSDPTNRGFQAIQSKIAIGSGGWFGTGFTMGPQKRSGFIPEHWTDFVFSVVGEEFGFVGVLFSLSLFLGFLLVLVQIARRAADPYASLVVFGIIGLVFTHMFENIGMTVGVMPITGIPLPFYSYGGSFTLVLALAMGLVFRAAREGRAASYVDN